MRRRKWGIYNASQKGSLTERYIDLANGIDKAVEREDHSFNPLILRLILEIVGKTNVFIQASIRTPETSEHKWPERVVLYNEYGKPSNEKTRRFIFGAIEADEIYHMF